MAPTNEETSEEEADINVVWAATGKKGWAQPNENDWEAVNITVDSGAVGTVGPKGIAKGIPTARNRSIKAGHVLPSG